MKAFKFQAEVDKDLNLKIPQEVAARIPRNQPLQVILLLPDPLEQESWQHLTQEQFLRGYSEGDSIYDSI